jgi:cell wall assembly regulator SMI1
MSTTIHESKAPVTEAQVAKLEEEMGIRLPSEYRQFLLKHNGGYPEPDGFVIHGRTEDEDGMVDRFLAIHDGEHDNLSRYLKWYKGRLPRNLFPVAHDPGGNLICISTSGADVGKVYFWDHDEEVEEGVVPDYRNVYLLADDFVRFLNGLKET